MAELPVTLASCGGQVVGMLHVPEGPRPPTGHPAVLFLHGFTGSSTESHRLFVVAARSLASSGILSLRIDFRGSGNSEGDFSTMTVSGEIADAKAALAWLRARPEVDPSRIGIVGMSMGGMVASLVAAGKPALRALVLWAPVGNPARLLASRMNDRRRADLAAKGIADVDGWPVGAAFVDDVVRHEPIKATTLYCGPVLLLHGTQDLAVPPDEGAMYVEARRRAGVPLDVEWIHGADHTFTSLAWTGRLIERSVTWLTARL